jgi:hypothetical protein
MVEEYEEMKKIALLTSGGDAPGMNAAIRAVVDAQGFAVDQAVIRYLVVRRVEEHAGRAVIIVTGPIIDYHGQVVGVIAGDLVIFALDLH